MPDSNPAISMIIHASTADSLKRARNNAVNILRSAPDAQLRILANADAVPAALDEPHETDAALLVLCETTLARIGKAAPPSVKTEPGVALSIAHMQQQGWLYMHA